MIRFDSPSPSRRFLCVASLPVRVAMLHPVSDNDPVDEPDHYFTAEPSGDSTPRTVEFALSGRRFELKSSSGVFSSSRLDPGTAALLAKAPFPDPGRTVLDLGCGYGPIALALAELASATVYAVDVNSRALELARHNADMRGLTDRVTVLASDEVPDDLQFDEIWSNPPIRVGKQSLHNLLSHWLPRLRPGGTAWLVVARHKGGDSMITWLNEQGYEAGKYASKKGYRVVRVVRPA